MGLFSFYDELKTWEKVVCIILSICAVCHFLTRLCSSEQITSSSYGNSKTSSSITSTSFGVGKWEGHEGSVWDANWSYTYELSLYNDGTAEGIITNHGPAGEDKEQARGHWSRKNASFADKMYHWTEVKITAGKRLHCFYVDNAGNAYAPFGRHVWEAIRDDKPSYTFRKIQ